MMFDLLSSTRRSTQFVAVQLHSQGVGASTNSVALIPLEDEEVLLDEKIMSMDDPISLQNMAFFYNNVR